MSEVKRKNSELSSTELCRLLECKEEELDDFVEVDLTYMSSDTLTIRYDTIPALDFLISLERLTISNHAIRDLSPIKRLTKLKYVNVSKNAISDIKPLTSLYLLEELYLDYNNICTFPRDLHKLRNLRLLSLSHNKITYDSFQDLLALTQLESLDLTYNPVLMRDKENRRNLVYFLHNRLHHFELFNGIHINTLFARVSCGKDYLEDILSTTDDDAFHQYFVPSRYVMTIGMKKNLMGRKPVSNEVATPPKGDLTLSPFCLEEPDYPQGLSPPHTPTFCLRTGQCTKDDQREEEHHRTYSVERPEEASHRDSSSYLHRTAFSSIRGRSMSMFERLDLKDASPVCETKTEKAIIPDERGERRNRTFSIHDVILQKNPSAPGSSASITPPVISPPVITIPKAPSPLPAVSPSVQRGRSMIRSMTPIVPEDADDMNELPVPEHTEGTAGRVMTGTTRSHSSEPKLERRKSLFSKLHRAQADGHRPHSEQGLGRLFEEMRSFNSKLDLILSNQSRIEAKLDALEEKVDMALKVVGVQDVDFENEEGDKEEGCRRDE